MTEHKHYIIHKPFGYLSQFINNQTKRKNKKLLGELGDFPEGIMSIGRLDEDSEGLLFLTTDGKVSQEVRSKKVEKEYWVQLDGQIIDSAIQELRNGVEITVHKKKYTTLPCVVSKIECPKNLTTRGKKIRDERHGPTSWISITITEGKFRQVRKMTAAVGFPTLRLVRHRIGNTHLKDLKTGAITEVSKFDL